MQDCVLRQRLSSKKNLMGSPIVKLAFLIGANIAQASIASGLLAETSRYGTATIKRTDGYWQKLAHLVLVVSLVAATTVALAQNLPPPSRTVYKCDVAGKIVYSDSPCLGAVRVDVEPTRGVSKLSGKEQVGKDVRDERLNEGTARALQPIFGETAAERALRHRRAKLRPEDARECANLDADMAAEELAERSAKAAELAAVQRRLYQLRLQHKQLRC